jgi:hypothetical protein
MSTPQNVLTSATKQAASLLPEPAINTPYTAAANFEGEATQTFNFTMPNLQQTPNTGLVGSGPDATDVTAGYWTQPGVQTQNRVNTGQMAKRLVRHMGGGSQDVVVATGVWDHFITLRPYDGNPQLDGTTFIVKYGGLDFILSSMVSNVFRIQHQNGADPVFTNALLGTGKHQWVGDVSPAFGAIPRFNALQNYGRGATCYLTLNDGQVRNLSSLGRYRQFTMEANNNLKANDQRGGDPLVADVGMIAKVVMTTPGTGYTTPPAVAFTGGGGGTGAAGVAVISTAGAVTGVRITNRGTAYTSSPTIAFTGGGGTGAAGVALLGPDADFGAYVRNLLRGQPTFSQQDHIHVDGVSRDEFMNHWNGVEILQHSWLNRGARIGQTNYFNEVEVITPRSRINTIAPEDQSDDALLILDYIPMLDTANGELAVWKARIRNGSATLI